MKKIFQRIYFWLYIKIHSMLISISIALYNTEIDILKPNSGVLNSKHSKIQRMVHRNAFIEMMLKGQKDEVMVQQYYELLKKADEFKRNTTPFKIGVTADKHRMNYGRKDRYGRRYEHYGFFDEKHKHSGKTLGEVLDEEMKDRRTKDDDYEILYIFNNKPTEVGLGEIFDVVEKIETEESENEYEVKDIKQKSKTYKFPIIIMREKDVTNKIEQLTEFLHIKKIGFNHRQLEFFIPLKYKIDEIKTESDIFKELTEFTYVKIKNDYGHFMSFKLKNYIKRIKYNETHEVWKFDAIEMEDIGLEQN